VGSKGLVRRNVTMHGGRIISAASKRARWRKIDSCKRRRTQGKREKEKRMWVYQNKNQAGHIEPDGKGEKKVGMAIFRG